ncbi:MAG: glycosyltransferase family 2 protein [Methyloligellaceae bacterium]
MKEQQRISVIIPALNEEKAIKNVLADIPDWVDDVIVVDNGSTDETARVASSNGARVIHEPRRGYGQACLTGIQELKNCDIVVFLDGDYSDYPNEMHLIVDPILNGAADLVLGSRTAGKAQKGALTLQQQVGNNLACFLMRLLWKTKYTDLGPFRAIKHGRLMALAMSDKGYGWTIEMQIKAALHNLKIMETPVNYRARIGVSKISGTLTGSVSAGFKILSLITLYMFKYGIRFYSK